MVSKSDQGGVTIGDVAAAAGVSRSTVSRVLNGRSTVHPDIVRRVRATAEQLRYAPSATARNLSLGRTQTVALVVPDLANPVFQDVMHGLSNGAARDGYRVLVADTSEEVDTELETALEARRRCDALVLCAPRMSDDELRDLADRASPAVVINRDPARLNSHVLCVDYAAATKALVSHLYELGHRELAYVTGPDRSTVNADRIQALHDQTVALPDLRVTHVAGGPQLTDGYASAEAVLATRATAAVAYNDLVAFGLLTRLNETGVDVPADISVAGFDDIVFARYAIPALTTMAVPYAQLGQQAWERLRASMDGTPGGHAIYFRPRLTVRSSTGPVPWRYSDGSDAGFRRRRRVEWFDATTERTTGALTGSPAGPPRWRADRDAYVLEAGSLPLARYESGDHTPQVHAPRPYLHPVHTSSGIPLTEVSPVDHRHHYGVSLALPDVNGTTFWGGRTFVRDRGPELLANHGRQHSLTCTVSSGRLEDQLTWYDENNSPLLGESRSLEAFGSADGDTWLLRWRSVLTAGHGELRLASPATEGRSGAGYGGIFWRFPEALRTEVYTAAGEGVENAHGCTSPWLAIVQQRAEGASTVLLQQPTDAVLPWFIRAADYTGVCPAIAWDSVRTVPADTSLTLELTAVIVDGALDLEGINSARARAEAAPRD